MPRFRVTLTRTSVEIVTADNPYQAAIAASQGRGDGAQVTNVASAVGRPGGASMGSANTAKKSFKKVVKKRRPMSPEARAKLAQNLVKARAARARNLKAAKKSARKTTKKSPAKKAKRTTKKR